MTKDLKQILQDVIAGTASEEEIYTILQSSLLDLSRAIPSNIQNTNQYHYYLILLLKAWSETLAPKEEQYIQTDLSTGPYDRLIKTAKNEIDKASPTSATYTTAGCIRKLETQLIDTLYKKIKDNKLFAPFEIINIQEAILYLLKSATADIKALELIAIEFCDALMAMERNTKQESAAIESILLTLATGESKAAFSRLATRCNDKQLGYGKSSISKNHKIKNGFPFKALVTKHHINPESLIGKLRSEDLERIIDELISEKDASYYLSIASILLAHHYIDLRSRDTTVAHTIFYLNLANPEIIRQYPKLDLSEKQWQSIGKKCHDKSKTRIEIAADTFNVDTKGFFDKYADKILAASFPLYSTQAANEKTDAARYTVEAWEVIYRLTKGLSRDIASFLLAHHYETTGDIKKAAYYLCEVDDLRIAQKQFRLELFNRGRIVRLLLVSVEGAKEPRKSQAHFALAVFKLREGDTETARSHFANIIDGATDLMRIESITSDELQLLLNGATSDYWGKAASQQVLVELMSTDFLTAQAEAHPESVLTHSQLVDKLTANDSDYSRVIELLEKTTAPEKIYEFFDIRQLKSCLVELLNQHKTDPANPICQSIIKKLFLHYESHHIIAEFARALIILLNNREEIGELAELASSAIILATYAIENAELQKTILKNSDLTFKMMQADGFNIDLLLKHQPELEDLIQQHTSTIAARCTAEELLVLYRSKNATIQKSLLANQDSAEKIVGYAEITYRELLKIAQTLAQLAQTTPSIRVEPHQSKILPSKYLAATVYIRLLNEYLDHLERAGVIVALKNIDDARLAEIDDDKMIDILHKYNSTSAQKRLTPHVLRNWDRFSPRISAEELKDYSKEIDGTLLCEAAHKSKDPAAKLRLITLVFSDREKIAQAMQATNEATSGIITFLAINNPEVLATITDELIAKENYDLADTYLARLVLLFGIPHTKTLADKRQELEKIANLKLAQPQEVAKWTFEKFYKELEKIKGAESKIELLKLLVNKTVTDIAQYQAVVEILGNYIVAKLTKSNIGKDNAIKKEAKSNEQNLFSAKLCKLILNSEALLLKLSRLSNIPVINNFYTDFLPLILSNITSNDLIEILQNYETRLGDKQPKHEVRVMLEAARDKILDIILLNPKLTLLFLEQSAYISAADYEKINNAYKNSSEGLEKILTTYCGNIKIANKLNERLSYLAINYLFTNSKHILNFTIHSLIEICSQYKIDIIRILRDSTLSNEAKSRLALAELKGSVQYGRIFYQISLRDKKLLDYLTTFDDIIAFLGSSQPTERHDELATIVASNKSIRKILFKKLAEYSNPDIVLNSNDDYYAQLLAYFIYKHAILFKHYKSYIKDQSINGLRLVSNEGLLAITDAHEKTEGDKELAAQAMQTAYDRNPESTQFRTKMLRSKAGIKILLDNSLLLRTISDDQISGTATTPVNNIILDCPPDRVSLIVNTLFTNTNLTAALSDYQLSPIVKIWFDESHPSLATAIDAYDRLSRQPKTRTQINYNLLKSESGTIIYQLNTHDSKTIKQVGSICHDVAEDLSKEPAQQKFGNLFSHSGDKAQNHLALKRIEILRRPELETMFDQTTRAELKKKHQEILRKRHSLLGRLLYRISRAIKSKIDYDKQLAKEISEYKVVSDDSTAITSSTTADLLQAMPSNAANDNTEATSGSSQQLPHMQSGGLQDVSKESPLNDRVANQHSPIAQLVS